eukprot:4002563-Pleurochrysis_carterae.AAC.1
MPVAEAKARHRAARARGRDKRANEFKMIELLTFLRFNTTLFFQLYASTWFLIGSRFLLELAGVASALLLLCLW